MALLLQSLRGGCVMRLVLVLVLLGPLVLGGCTTMSPCIDSRELNNRWKCDNRRELLREYAARTAPYAIASLNIYDVPASTEEGIPLPDTDEIWTVVAELQEPSLGFAGRSWERVKANGDKELVVAFRGTGGPEDYDILKDFFFANFVFVNFPIGRTQFDVALDFTRTSLVKYGDSEVDVVLTGHSLGGGLAEYVNGRLPNSRAVNFNSSPNTGFLYTIFGRFWELKAWHENKEVLRIYELGEVLALPKWFMPRAYGLQSSIRGDGARAARYDFFARFWRPGTQHSMKDVTSYLLRAAATLKDPVGMEKNVAMSVLKNVETRRTKTPSVVPAACLGQEMNLGF
jgi:hypothetical protein